MSILRQYQNNSRRKRKSARSAVFLLLVFLSLTLFFVGCAGLPDYAKPLLFSVAENLPSNVIGYRDLDKGDFQAKELPVSLKDYAKKLNAHTAASIRPTLHSKYFVSLANFAGKQWYLGHVKELSFEAVMIPGRSWWNPTLRKSLESYVLQHEQIHFALMEIAARKLSDKAEAIDIEVFEASFDEAKQSLKEKIEILIAETLQAVIKEHIAFDENTSQFHDPEKQQWWYDQVTTKLKSQITSLGYN